MAEANDSVQLTKIRTRLQTAVERMIGFSVALTGIIVLLAMMGLEVRKIDRQLAEIERLLSVDDETANG
jgi:ABC-type cobalamin transport system permease subunit